MKVFVFLLAVLSVLAVTYAWDKEDHEIFDLVSDLVAAEGKGINFYSHIGVDPSATTGEINKAYRKKSLELHPDKNPGVKNIQERFARLGVISQILRSPERRERYNFFFKNGVPTWRGTGYYYSRFRPTLTHTLAFLVLLTSLFHLLVLHLNYNRDAKRVAYFNRTAIAAAKAGQGKKEKVDEDAARRVKVPMVEGNEMSGYLELMVIGEDVYLPHEDGSLDPLSGLATSPSFFRTWPFTLTQSALERAVALLPPHIQSSLPSTLRSAAVEAPIPAEVEGYDVSKSRKKKKSGASGTNTPRDTPRDSPVTTELESDEAEVEEDGEVVEGENGEKKKKKRGVGKAGGARRRKMGMKN